MENLEDGTGRATDRPQEDVRMVGEPADLAALFLALAKAQGEFLPLIKDSTAKVSNKEGRALYTFDYCSLDVVIAAVQPALTKYELAVFQAPTGGGSGLLTVLAHGKARIEAICPVTRWDTPQDFGGAVTYFRRYALMSMLSVYPAGEDDDGNVVSGNRAEVQPRVVNRQPPQASAAEEAVHKLKHEPQRITSETKAKVLGLAKRLNLTTSQLLEFSLEHKCGALNEQTEVNGLRLAVELDKAALLAEERVSK